MRQTHEAGVAGALELAEVARAEEERRTIEQRTGVKMSNAEFTSLFGYLIDDAELDERCRLETSSTSRLAERRRRLLDAHQETIGPSAVLAISRRPDARAAPMPAMSVPAGTSPA
jgi:hypothetical protein